uniref:Uncharacterized protein n=1 Tax=Timema cristinae TaxID=61476 RepID=A0A7R9GSR8_TIMCR|nr:unnamed protein product [Timema cristinae]
MISGRRDVLFGGEEGRSGEKFYLGVLWLHVPREQSVSIMLNGEESELWFINVANPKMEMDRVSPPDAFVVMYSVIDKASFQRAEDELARLQDWGLMRSRPAILVGNKVDLARSRAISTQDGKCLACTYRAKFIEISVGISHNIDELLVGILNQIRLKLANAERETSAHWYRSRGVVRASMKARQMFTWIFGKEDSKFKNCENLHMFYQKVVLVTFLASKTLIPTGYKYNKRSGQKKQDRSSQQDKATHPSDTSLIPKPPKPDLAIY